MTGRVKVLKTGLEFDSSASFERSSLVALARCVKKQCK